MGLPADQEGAAIRLGLSENRVQFILLMIVNAFVGAMVGVERSVLPTLAESEFGVTSAGAAFSFLVAFGLAKALANDAAAQVQSDSRNWAVLRDSQNSVELMTLPGRWYPTSSLKRFAGWFRSLRTVISGKTVTVSVFSVRKG